MSLTLLPVTLVFAGALALINLWLAFRVGQVRRSERVSIGDGGAQPVIRRMRAQANFVEFAPFVLALVGLIEFSTGTSMWLWLAAGLFVAGRLTHPFGMDGWLPGRMAGIGVTFLVTVALALWAIAIPVAARGDAADEPVELSVPQG